jgi:G:T-mismatch repair DNA endonuclease (very short patch repair protein)
MNNGQAASMGKKAKGCKKPNTSILMQGNQRGANADRSGEKERYRNQALKQHAENNFGIWDDERRNKQSQITKERWASGNLHCVWRPKWHSDLEKLLLDNDISFESEYSIKKSFEGKRLYKPYDVYLPSFNLLIELQGCFWHGCVNCCIKQHPRQEKVKKNDLEKKEFAEKCGYKIIQIWEHDKQKIHGILADLGILN